MNSRERVMAALEHREADRVPLDCGGTVVSGIDAIAYNNLKRHLGVRGGETKIYHMVMQVALPEQWFRDRFETDVIDLADAYCQDPSEWKDWTLHGGSPAKVPAWMPLERRGDTWVHLHRDGTVLGEMPAHSPYFDQTYWPAADSFDPERLPEYMDHIIWHTMSVPRWGTSGEPGYYEDLRMKAKRYYEQTPYAVAFNFGASLVETTQRILRHDNFFATLASEPVKMGAILDYLTEGYLAQAEKFVKAISGYVQIIRVTDDMGMQDRPQFSPRMYREIFKPRHKAIYDVLKKAGGAKIFMHCCGSVYRLIPDLIDAGVDILNPIQTSAAEMDPRRLKEEFGKDLVLWGGGCDNQSVLAHRGPSDVRREVEEKMAVLAPGGGYVFNQVHNIVQETPPENIVAMLETFRRHRDYR